MVTPPSGVPVFVPSSRSAGQAGGAAGEGNRHRNHSQNEGPSQPRTAEKCLWRFVLEPSHADDGRLSRIHR